MDELRHLFPKNTAKPEPYTSPREGRDNLRLPHRGDRVGDGHRLIHLRTEAREKLSRIRPLNLAQAARISGITPADLAVPTVRLGRRSRRTASHPSEKGLTGMDEATSNR